ncbi:hypothetical protein HPB48_022721 [Haemaphysalis longicornis]|uniref:Uncharacterized protein n=1 Tax=Haemaphysalis longicornis TaxID=44386 RepID=A0A9J6FVQ1_HAELO|nr:hypothetical protein HPB48_022721 [Haemaphysalis longicornis]
MDPLIRQAHLPHGLPDRPLSTLQRSQGYNAASFMGLQAPRRHPRPNATKHGTRHKKRRHRPSTRHGPAGDGHPRAATPKTPSPPRRAGSRRP